MSTENTEQNSPQYNAIFADRHVEKITLGRLLNKGGAAGKVLQLPICRVKWLRFFMNGKRAIRIA